MEDNKLSPEQIKNWRMILCGMLGPYAMIMPDSQVQALRDKWQTKINEIDVSLARVLDDKPEPNKNYVERDITKPQKFPSMANIRIVHQKDKKK